MVRQPPLHLLLLRDRLLERGKQRLVVRHQVRLADRRQRLQLGVVARPRLDVEALAADADRAGRDEDDAVARLAQRRQRLDERRQRGEREVAGVAAEDRGGADLDDDGRG